tara:strand:- start:185 stop:436 length:252 start_codon:yes stop_codon:yes gene_type:complete
MVKFCKQPKELYFTNKIEKLATKENAADYAHPNNNGCWFVFCLDLLELNVDDYNSEYWVNKLEDKFDAINGFSPWEDNRGKTI